MAECGELIPEHLRGDLDAVTSKDPLLPRERNVVEVLVDGDLDRERERVATSANGALGPGSSLDAAAALAE